MAAEPVLSGASDWAPWPWNAEPQSAALDSVGEGPIVCLAGAAGLPQGRWGVVGTPGNVRPLPSGAAGLEQALGGWQPGRVRVAVLPYEMGFPLVHLPPARSAAPAGVVMDVDHGFIVDHEHRRMRALGDGVTLSRPRPRTATPTLSATPAVSDRRHAEAIRRALDHIAAGDVYQVNVSRPLLVDGDLDVVSTFRRLRRDAVPHAALVRAGGVAIVSQSMETLLEMTAEGRVLSRPIKGTLGREAPGGPSQLAADVKERAEHVMIVDLVRNDLGRVCEPGTVRCPKLMSIEGYRGLWHGVSEVVGVTAAPPAAVLGALFPGGSITGAPKRRAMQIIASLEPRPRGFYTGSLVVVFPNGRVCASILIRTLQRVGDGFMLNVGGGIVADSNPLREIAETWEKARAFSGNLAGR